MILGLDTDVLVSWAMTGAPQHVAARRLFEREIRRGSGHLGLTPQVLHEFLHVVTDARRFSEPLSMERARTLAADLWDAMEVERIVPPASVVHRTLELMGRFGLGRKRILDTALAATLEAAGVRRLATWNGADFAIFPFLEVIAPA
jgi:predicted nucleic acid-binding protein